MRFLRIVFLFVFVLSAGDCFAENVTLSQVCDGLTKHQVTTGAFVQIKKSAAIKRALKSSGTFIFCDEGVVWNTAVPVCSTVAVTKTSLIQTAPDGTRTVIDGSRNQVFANIAGTISALFSGDRAQLEKNFSIDFVSAADSWKANLFPKDRTVAVSVKSIALSGKYDSDTETSLDAVMLTEASGDSISYTFREQQYKGSLTDEEKDFFTFR